MKVAIAFVLLFPLSASIWSQGIHSTIYSPVEGREIVIPYAETDFLSIRMRGLGYQLHNVVEDTVTNLFRNSVAIYDLKKSLLVANYENAPGQTVIRPDPIPPIVTTTMGGDPGIIYENHPENLNGFASINANSSVVSTTQPFFVSGPYLSVGYWSPQLWGILPAGIFIKSSLQTSEKSEQSVSPLGFPFGDIYDASRDNRAIRDREFFGKLWLGLRGGPGLKLSLSYDLHYFSRTVEQQSEERSSGETPNDYRASEQLRRLDDGDDWIGHHLGLASRFSMGNWDVQTEISGLLFRNDRVFNRHDDAHIVRYTSVAMDSLISLEEWTGIIDQDFERSITGVEIDLQARRNEWVAFATVSVLDGSVDEFYQLRDERFWFSYGDTLRDNFRNRVFLFDDGGMLYRAWFGVGRHFTVKERFHIYSEAVAAYVRNGMSGDLRFTGTEDLMNYGDSSFVDTSYSSPLDFTSQRWRLSLPVGFEYRTRVVSVRLGLNWYYRRDETETHYGFGEGREDFHHSFTSSGFDSEQFFGFGLRWKSAQLNIAAFSDIFRFSAWHVGLRYAF